MGYFQIVPEAYAEPLKIEKTQTLIADTKEQDLEKFFRGFLGRKKPALKEKAEPMKKAEILLKKDMVLIPGGEFMKQENPPVVIQIEDFFIDKYEVTQAEFEKEMGKNPSYFKGANRPVEQVTWDEANAFCEKVGKRLPNEWEWEKAARAGKVTKYYWGNDVGANNANCDGCGSQWDNKETAPVGSFKPNDIGLYDMAGNVWEWVVEVPSSGNWNVIRGGSWSGSPYYMEVADRSRHAITRRADNIGFRCSR